MTLTEYFVILEAVVFFTIMYWQGMEIKKIKKMIKNKWIISGDSGVEILYVKKLPTQCGVGYLDNQNF